MSLMYAHVTGSNSGFLGACVCAASLRAEALLTVLCLLLLSCVFASCCPFVLVLPSITVLCYPYHLLNPSARCLPIVQPMIIRTGYTLDMSWCIICREAKLLLSVQGSRIYDPYPKKLRFLLATKSCENARVLFP